MSILKEAREIVRTQPMNLKVGHLKVCADELQEAYDILKVSLTREASQEFVAKLTRCLRAIDMVVASEPTPPQGGALNEPAKLAVGY